MTKHKGGIPKGGPILRELKPSDFEAVMRFADANIGQDYFSQEKLENIFKATHKDGVTCSFVLEDDQGIQGVRLSYPPNQWIARHPSQKIHPELWKTPLSQTGYFQSLFIAEKYQGKGWGQRLSMAAVENLKSLGAKAIVCHSWDESPKNSSRKYLDRFGFIAVISIPKFWYAIDYECTRCGKPCVCTATEMVYYI
jgi:GNAT superfamily N-acetyltransferase